MRHMLIPRNHPLLGGLLAAVLTAGVAHAADTKDTARAVFERSKDAVITVSAVVKMEVAGRSSRGQEVELCGAVIGADGLTLVSSTTLNPAAAALDSLERVGGEERVGSTPKIDLLQVKYRLADGTEVPARLVYQDRDLDLAFLVPDLKEGERPPKFTSLEVKPGPAARELDDAFCVTRLPKHMSYTPAVMIGHIVAVVTKPRTVYDFALTGTPIPGSPVFHGSGSLLGFMMIHRIGGSTRALRALLGGTQEIVIMPAGEVAGLIDQARQAAAKQRDKPEKSGDGSAQDKKEQEKDTQ